jgi:hypothetical protein
VPGGADDALLLAQPAERTAPADATRTMYRMGGRESGIGNRESGKRESGIERVVGCGCGSVGLAMRPRVLRGMVVTVPVSDPDQAGTRDPPADSRFPIPEL